MGYEDRWIPYFLIALVFILGCVISLWVTPLIRRAAINLGIVDRPDNDLKNHDGPIPYLGGLAIYISFLLSLAMIIDLNRFALALLLSGSIVLIVGLIDDFGVLSPSMKLMGQAIAVAVLIKAGIFIKLAFIPWYISFPLSFLWLIGITNAFNLIDIMDGLSSGVGCITATILCAVALLNGRLMIAVVAAALAGSLLGFLKYNFHPASIYMGDAGSLFIGLILGALAMIGSYTTHNTVSCLAPVLLLGIPIFDMLFVMYVRKRRGLPMMLGSPDHFALRLRKWRLSVRQTVLVSYGISLLLGIFAFVMMFLNDLYAAIILTGIMAATLLVTFFLKKIDMTM